MKILITGASGFLATHLAKKLSEIGCHEVYGCDRYGISKPFYTQVYKIYFGKPFVDESNIFDWVIHCLYDQHSSVKENIDSTLLWAQQFKKMGVRQQLFISTIGVKTGNSSEYARAKQGIEQWFIEQNMPIVRPGLIVGNGGLFHSIVHKVKRYPILPLIDGGKQKVKLIGIDDLVEELVNVIEAGINKHKPLDLFYASEPTMKELLYGISQIFQKNIFFISIPYVLIYGCVKILEILKINIGITTTSIKGLKENDVILQSDLTLNPLLEDVLLKNCRG